MHITQDITSNSRLFQPRTTEGVKAFLRPRYSLILAAVGVMMGGFIITKLSVSPEQNIEVQLESVNKTTAGQIKMTGARYSGITDTGTRFTLHAEQAEEDAEQKGLIHLFKSDGFITDQNKTRTNMTANQALYHASTHRIDLVGNVVIHQNMRHDRRDVTLKTQSMTSFIESGEMYSSAPVSVTAPDMHIEARRMTARAHGQVMRFEGTTTARLKTQ